jgi:hypothetical protein
MSTNAHDRSRSWGQAWELAGADLLAEWAGAEI